MTEAHDTLQVLKDLPELVDKAWVIITAMREREVEFGILNKAEAETLLLAVGARDEINEAVSKARRDIPRPTIELPPEYLELKEQLKEVDEKYNQVHKIREALGQLKPTSLGSNSIANRVNLTDLAEQAFVPFRVASEPIISEHFKLQKAIDTKERANTIVSRRRAEAWDKHREAEVKAENRVREELEPKYRELFAEEIRIKAKARQRTGELIAPIREEIRIILETAIKGK